MLETKCPLRVTALIPLISCQIIQNAPNPLNLSTGREKKFPHPRENLWVHFNHPKWKPPLIFIRDFTVAICIIYSDAPLKGQFPLKPCMALSHCVETMAYVQVEWGKQMDDISLSTGNDSIKEQWWRGAPEFQTQRADMGISRHVIVSLPCCHLWPCILKPVGLSGWHHKRWLLKLTSPSFRGMHIPGTESVNPGIFLNLCLYSTIAQATLVFPLFSLRAVLTLCCNLYKHKFTYFPPYL